jgi:hypothetical protein
MRLFLKIFQKFYIYNIYKMSHPTKLQWIPVGQRNPFTVFYKYANQDIILFNRYANKYNLEKLPNTFGGIILTK